MPAGNLSTSLVTNERAPNGFAARTALEPVRVLHVNSGNLFGGVETILLTLARLRDLCPGMDCHFALCHEGRLSTALREAGACVHILGRVRMSRPWSVRNARRNLREILRRERFDMVICHMPWSLAVFGRAVRAQGQRLGFWAHGFHSGHGWLELVARWTKPDLAIANSAFTENGLANLFQNVPHQVVYAPIALNPSPERDLWRSSLRQREGIDDDTVVIIQVSRLESWKGHLLHLDALAHLQSMPQWRCWMVGGPQRPEEEVYLGQLQRAATRLGVGERVQFMGQRSDIPQLLAAADIFCQPNLGPEPFGIVFIEALWAGRPVVTTAIGGAVEIVDESCGLLVEPGNPASLAASLHRLIECPKLRARLGQAGADRARLLCDPASQMKKLMDLSRSGMGGGRDV